MTYKELLKRFPVLDRILTVLLLLLLGPLIGAGKVGKWVGDGVMAFYRELPRFAQRPLIVLTVLFFPIWFPLTSFTVICLLFWPYFAYIKLT